MASGDFVLQVACELPLQAIAGLLGVPLEDRGKLFDWTNQMIGDEDPEFAEYDSLDSAAELIWYAMQLAARKAEDARRRHRQHVDRRRRRRAAHRGRVRNVRRDPDRRRQRDDPQSITQGMMAFTDFPEQWELFKAQRPKTAADEIIRWASPINAFQRTALADTELGGVQIKKGQRLVLFYRSANFDEETSSTIRSASTSCEIPIPIWDSAAPARTTASAPTSRG